jgi:hypothetical protein
MPNLDSGGDGALPAAYAWLRDDPKAPKCLAANLSPHNHLGILLMPSDVRPLSRAPDVVSKRGASTMMKPIPRKNTRQASFLKLLQTIFATSRLPQKITVC